MAIALTRKPHWWHALPHLQTGHSLQLFTTGQEYFPALQTALAEAKTEILFETYIFAADAVGCTIWQALLAAAQRGVRVRLLLDGHGAMDFPDEWAQALQQAHARCLWYRPHRRGWFLQHTSLRRLHRKLVVVDGHTAFVGGINVQDDFDHGTRLPRYDFALRLEGPLVQRIRQRCRSLWAKVSWRQRCFEWLPGLATNIPQEGTQHLGWVERDNLRHRHQIEQLYLKLIRQARHEIILCHAYFLPGWRIRHALHQARQRGVHITLLLPGPTDHPWLQWASTALYPEWLTQGWRIYHYQAAPLHAKVLVVDQQGWTLGSANLDPLSLRLAREANVWSDDPNIARQLATSIKAACQNQAQRIEQPRLGRGRSLLAHTVYALVRLLFTLLPGHILEGYWGPNHEDD